MVIREFTEADLPEAERRFGPEAGELIARWREKVWNGKFFEMLAVEDGGALVGTVSLLEHSRSAVSLGIEIFPEYRRRGRATAACALALERARKRGYKIAMDQVRADNQASAALHRRLGFENDGYVYINRKGSEVLIYIMPLD